MQIQVNGLKEVVPDPDLSIAGLLQFMKIESPDMVSVQLNGSIIERDAYSTIMVSENDEIDFLYFMGGGSR